jgi:hypothetical protein
MQPYVRIQSLFQVRKCALSPDLEDIKAKALLAFWVLETADKTGTSEGNPVDACSAPLSPKSWQISIDPFEQYCVN